MWEFNIYIIAWIIFNLWTHAYEIEVQLCILLVMYFVEFIAIPALDSAYSNSCAPDESTATPLREWILLRSKDHPHCGTELSKSTWLFYRLSNLEIRSRRRSVLFCSRWTSIVFSPDESVGESDLHRFLSILILPVFPVRTCVFLFPRIGKIFFPLSRKGIPRIQNRWNLARTVKPSLSQGAIWTLTIADLP